MDTDGKTVITPGYTYLSPFCHDVALARTDTDNSTAYSLINTKGSTVMTFPEDMTPVSTMITAELLPVKRTEGCGFINLQGDYRAMPAKVTDIKEYNNDYFVYLSSDLHEGAMSIYYDEVLPAEYDRIKLLGSDRFVACAGGEWNLYNEKGAKVASLSDYKDVYVLQQWPFESDFSLMGRTPEDKINLLDENGREVTTTDFTNIKFNSYKSIVSDYLNLTDPGHEPHRRQPGGVCGHQPCVDPQHQGALLPSHRLGLQQRADSPRGDHIPRAEQQFIPLDIRRPRNHHPHPRSHRATV